MRSQAAYVALTSFLYRVLRCRATLVRMIPTCHRDVPFGAITTSTCMEKQAAGHQRQLLVCQLRR